MWTSIDVMYVKDNEKECPHQEVFIDHDTKMCLRHEAVWVQEAEDGDGGGQEDAQHLSDEVSNDIVVKLRDISKLLVNSCEDYKPQRGPRDRVCIWLAHHQTTLF